MAKYTVRDEQTGKRITFDWHEAGDPTDADMEEIFAEARGGAQPAPGWEAGRPVYEEQFGRNVEALKRGAREALGETGRTFTEQVGEGAGDVTGGLRFAAKGVGEALRGVEEGRLEPMIAGVGKVGAGAVKTLLGGTQAAFAPVTAALRGAGKVLVEEPLKAAGMTPEQARANAAVAEMLAPGAAPEALVANIGRFPGAVGERLSMVAPFTRAQRELRYPVDIRHAYKKAINPSAKALGTTAARNKRYYDDVQSGVESITANKPNLALTTPEGEILESTLPQNRGQFLEAVEQTKKKLFDEYDSIVKQAGVQGIAVPDSPVLGVLDNISANARFQKFSPGVVRYAKKRRAEIAARGELGVTEAQEVVRELNNKTRSAFQNPGSYTEADRIAVDVAIADAYRTGIAQSLEQLGPEWAQLRQEYGALSTIEKDVAAAARRNVGHGLQDVTDLVLAAGAGKAIAGGATTTLTGAAAAAAAARARQFLNNPDRVTRRMFERVEKAQQKGVPRGTGLPPKKEYVPPPPPPPKVPTVEEIYGGGQIGRRPVVQRGPGVGESLAPSGPTAPSVWDVYTTQQAGKMPLPRRALTEEERARMGTAGY